MPNTVVKLTNAESTWLEAAREDRKLLIKLKRTSAKMSFLLCFHLVQGSGFKVQGCGGGFAAFFIERCPKVVFKSRVTSHSYDTREGIVSHVWHEILRLSPHLFWLGLFTHRAFFSAQDDDTRGRKGSHFGDMLRVLELAVLYTIRVAS